MKVWVSVTIGPYDHPVAEIIAADEDEGPEVETITVWLTDDISLTGARVDVERWVRDLASQIAWSEGYPVTGHFEEET